MKEKMSAYEVPWNIAIVIPNNSVFVALRLSK